MSWRTTHPFLPLLAVLMAAALVLVPGASPAQAAERTFTYTVSTQGAVAADFGHFAAVARNTLSDSRGWTLGGTIAFQQVQSGSDFDLILASPQVIDNAAPGCSSQWSCRVGRSVYINDERWRLGTQSWTEGLGHYRQYVILHEVGHWLGVPHTDCPAAGRTAWVMQQQSISLQGCLANVWPVIAEQERVAGSQGVSVAWSSIEQKYRSMGQENGILGPPVTWERVTPDGTGNYQHYARVDGASIYWHPSSGAHEIYGAIRDRWAEMGWEYSGLGYPATGERTTPDGVGRYNHFSRVDGASIYWHPQTGAHEIYGAIRDRWAEMGWELSALGYPVSGEYGVDGGRRTDFQNGYIRYDFTTGETEVHTTG